MAQAFLDPKNRSGDAFRLTGSEAHHLIRVVRARAGDAVFLFDGAGRRWRGLLTEVDPAVPEARGRIESEIPAATRRFSLRLFQGLPRGPKFDFVVEKAVEIGVDEIRPFLSEKSPVRLSEEQGRGKIERWTRVAAAAAKQCNRATVPRVAAPVRLSETAPTLGSGVSIAFDERGEPLRDIVRAIERTDSGIINLIVGPESGFSADEREFLTGSGARLAALGPHTLRTETAGLVAAAILDYELNS